MDKMNTKQMNIMKLTIPIFFEMLLAILVSNIDQLMLSGYSAEAVAAIGNAGQISWVMILFFQVLGTASLILITQYHGAGRDEEAKAIYPLTLIVNVCIGLVLGIVCLFGIDFILTLLKIEDATTFLYAKQYMQIVGTAFIFMAISNCFSSFLKANALVKETMAISIMVNVINVIGNSLALFVFDAGVVGVAYATAFGRLVGMVLVIYVFYNKVGKIYFSALKKSRPFMLLGQLLKIGVPSVGENMSYDIAQLVLMSFINPMGTDVVNAKIYVTMVVQFAYVFTMSISQAMQIVEGHQLGADQKDAAAKSVYYALRWSICTSLILTIIICIFSDWIVGLFPSASAEVLAIAKQLLMVEILLEIGRAINITMVRALQTAGDVRYPVVMSIIFTWCLSVTMGYVLGVAMQWGIVGVWIANAADELFRGIVLIIRFKRGKWRKISLVKQE